MSVFDGEIDFRSVTMVDFDRKIKPKSPRRKAIDDNCLIVGVSRDALKPRDQPKKSPDVLCPLKHEFYKNAVKRFAVDHADLTKKYMEGDIDPKPVENEDQDNKRTEYLIKYCSRELPFMSVNLARRARALQTLRLPDDIEIPDTSHRSSYRHPRPEKYAELPSSMSMKPKYDDSLQSHKVTLMNIKEQSKRKNNLFLQLGSQIAQGRTVRRVQQETHKELRRILRVRAGDTTYHAVHGLLAKVVLEQNPFGKPRKEPRFGRWLTPYYYTYRIN